MSIQADLRPFMPLNKNGFIKWQPPKTPNSALRYIDEMLIYLL